MKFDSKRSIIISLNKTWSGVILKGNDFFTTVLMVTIESRFIPLQPLFMDYNDVCKIIEDYYITSPHREESCCFQRALLCSPRVVKRRLLMVLSSILPLYCSAWKSITLWKNFSIATSALNCRPAPAVVCPAVCRLKKWRATVGTHSLQLKRALCLRTQSWERVARVKFVPYPSWNLDHI